VTQRSLTTSDSLHRVALKTHATWLTLKLHYFDLLCICCSRSICLTRPAAKSRHGGLRVLFLFLTFIYVNNFYQTIAPLQSVQNAAARVVARLGPRNHVTPDSERPSLAARRTANGVLVISADASSSYRTSAILSSQLRHRISRHHFTSSSALHQLRTAAHASEVWRTFIFVCRIKSLEQSAIITA